MIRKIIEIDESRCNGCGLCAEACHENAIGIIDGKAKLLRDDYCDGLGNCLPACPMDAIHFIEREAAAYDEAAVKANQAAKIAAQAPAKPGCGCPGSAPKAVEHAPAATVAEAPGRLSNWPVQIQLAPIQAPYFDGADLLIAADCTAYAHGAFHERFIKGRAVVIGCPKLDGVNYAEKLAAILQSNDIRSITLTRMLVPCCGGLEYMAREALKNSGKEIPMEVVTIGIDGEILRVQKG